MEQINAQTHTLQNLLTEAAERFGTPLYVYDSRKIAVQIQTMRDAFAGVDLKLKYACKALTNINILRYMRQHGVEIDVVSIEEAQMALLAGYQPEQIQYTPSGVSFHEVKEAVALGIRMNLDSLPLLEEFGREFGNEFPICIRVNPSIMEGGNLKISTGHADSKFGIPYQQFDQVNDIVKRHNLNVVGLHQHTGSDFKNADVIIHAAEVLYDLAFNYFPNLDFIDLGSGFKVAYSANDHITDMHKLGKKVVKSFNNFKEKYGRDVQLWFEPGKFLVSECGYLLTRVNVVKENPNRTFACVNSGLNHLIRPMMYDAYHDIENISNPTGELKKYDVVGYICETDTFGADRMLNEVRENDLLCIKNGGAYGISMASNYNSRPLPAEAFYVEGELKLIRRHQTLENILSNQIF